jgi:hypothetical protein
MRVLVACEFSGVVRDAFGRSGHDAWSCDLLPDDTGPHQQRDVREILSQKWDMLIGHPPCQYMSNSGALRLYRGGKKANGRDPERWAQMEAAAAFFSALWNAPIPRIAVENPVMVGHAKRLIGVQQSQTIQPFQFGHPESKRTCLWLKGLPALKPTEVLTLPESGHWDNQTPSGQNKLGPSPDRWKLRAQTYTGIADAMASQWGTE